MIRHLRHGRLSQFDLSNILVYIRNGLLLLPYIVVMVCKLDVLCGEIILNVNHIIKLELNMNQLPCTHANGSMPTPYFSMVVT